MATQIEIKKMVLGIADTYARQVSEVGLEMWGRLLAEFSKTDLERAFITHANTGKFMPVPADIIQQLRPTPTEEQVGVEVASRIIEAMSRCGYLNPDQARQHMGELAWLVVEREGGWRNLCERTKSEDLPILKAQWRELAKALSVRSRAGILQITPNLPKQLERN